MLLGAAALLATPPVSPTSVWGLVWFLYLQIGLLLLKSVFGPGCDTSRRAALVPVLA